MGPHTCRREDSFAFPRTNTDLGLSVRHVVTKLHLNISTLSLRVFQRALNPLAPLREREKKKSPFLPCCCSNTTQTFYTHRTHNPISSNYCIIPGFKLTLGTLCFSIALLLSLLQHTVTQLLIFLKARITELQVGVPEVWDGVVECESCHGTQSTYHAKCRRECSSGPGRPSIPGKLIVINQVTETEQGLADDYLSPLPLLLPPPLLLFPSSSSSILYCFS